MKYLFYNDWVNKRIKAITDFYGAEWFQNKKVLELGCAHGDIGIALQKLGADVTFSDVRQEHLDLIVQELKSASILRLDNNTDWKYEGKPDLILHLGLLYLVENWKEDILNCFNYTDNMVLETAVIPVGHVVPEWVYNSPLYTSFNCKLPKFSDIDIEEYIISIGYKFKRMSNESLNSVGRICDRLSIKHTYTWNNEDCKNLVSDANNIIHFRRMWHLYK